MWQNMHKCYVPVLNKITQLNPCRNIKNRRKRVISRITPQNGKVILAIKKKILLLEFSTRDRMGESRGFLLQIWHLFFDKQVHLEF